jgi:DNA-binding MarR family transcriptional regulator
MKKKILDAFYAYEEERKKEGTKGTAGITIPMTIVCNMLHTRGKPIHEEYDLTQAEIDMLISLHVHNDGITATEVSDGMVFSSGGISKVVKKLESKKLIYKKDSKEDKRSSLIYLEDKGREIALACMPQFGKNDNYFYDVLNETEKDILEKAFKKILYSIAEKRENL